ncbi:TTF-type domain-containing protein [Trichonephila inaurata madagascariensis]|uniref:TTF-type domain-containing protein n=1 Tax=Trichonephila inaurata madagascariensis TaxID=2747483 RepID=A0A8X6YTE2_9ARAC|nr:TTF-type domain-containing protein [Trichonephila inaurata madagascariensis]
MLRNLLKFEKISENSIVSINKILDEKKAEEVHKNRHILCSIIKTVIFCGKQGIALRGNSDYGSLNLNEETNKNEGNFRALVKFRVEAGDDVLEKHFKDSGRNTYISWRTQNEIISSTNEIILKDIVNRVNKNEYFSIIADETTDIAGIQQLSLAVRFINANSIHEKFLHLLQ